MPETKRLYFEDVYLLEFDAEVVVRTEHEGLPAVILDRTAFYPESGGQPWDRGMLVAPRSSRSSTSMEPSSMC